MSPAYKPPISHNPPLWQEFLIRITHDASTVVSYRKHTAISLLDNAFFKKPRNVERSEVSEDMKNLTHPIIQTGNSSISTAKYLIDYGIDISDIHLSVMIHVGFACIKR